MELRLIQVNTVPGLNNSIYNLKIAAEQAEKEYNACALDLIEITSENVNREYSKVVDNQTLLSMVHNLSFTTGPNFYTWIDNKFYHLDEDDRASFADNSVWAPYNPTDADAFSSYFTYFDADPWGQGTKLDTYYARMQAAKYGENGFYAGLEQALAIQEKELILSND